MSDSTATWLFRIPEVFEPHAAEILAGLNATLQKRLGADYYLVRVDDAAALGESDWTKFVSWKLPVHHAWPCNPQKLEGFVEKAAQGIHRKFGGQEIQTLLAGPLQATGTHPYYRHLATNLRGRVLQLFPSFPVAEVEAQDPAAPTLFCLVGKEGLYCGVLSPREANGFYPGGTKFISQSGGISRAGAKIAEALHYLQLHRPVPEKGAHWLELGACPGGMTSELLARGYRVTAVDKAPLDSRLDNAPGLTFVRMDVDTFRLAEKDRLGGLLSDMNGDPRSSLRQVVRLSANLSDGAPIIFTLKSTAVEQPQEMIELARAAKAFAKAAGLRYIAETHLTYNRQEFTLFFER